MDKDRTFLISDTHFGHDKDFIWGKRGFRSVEEMDDILIRRWNNTISSNDVVYHLGDLVVGNGWKEHLNNIVPFLNGEIHLVIGNHDLYKIDEYEQFINIIEIQSSYIFESNKKTFILSHYPTLVKDANSTAESPVINFCGHIHTKNPYLHHDFGCYHVEVDAHDCFPISFQEACDNFLKYSKIRT